jgi:hypothetical protein
VRLDPSLQTHLKSLIAYAAGGKRAEFYFVIEGLSSNPSRARKGSWSRFSLDLNLLPHYNLRLPPNIDCEVQKLASGFFRTASCSISKDCLYV